MNKTKIGLFFLFLALICPFLTNISVIFLSVMFIFLGIAILFFILDGLALSKFGAISSSVFFIVFGLCLCLTTILIEKEILPNEYYLVTMGFGFGILFLTIFLYNVLKIFKCSKRIKGEYIGNSTQISNSLVLYVPLFKYNYNGVTYSNSTGQPIGYRKIRKFTLGQQYEINIYPKNPNIFRINKTITLTDISLLFMGSLLIMVAINALS